MIALGGRFFDKRGDAASIAASQKKILNFTAQGLGLADTTIIAINEVDDRSKAHDFLLQQNIQNLSVLNVKPWGFCSAMNTLIYQADTLQQDFLLSCSIEITMTSDVVNKMMAHMDPSVLCVGARLPEHEFYPGKTVPASGKTIPWNTCTLWNLKHLAITGFLLVGDASFDKSQAGVEELATMALLQHLYPSESKIKLVEIPGIEWHTEFSDDPIRRAAHERKMRMKVQRPRLQIGLLGLKEPEVEHIGLSFKEK